VGVAPGRLWQGPDNVQPPHSERPCDGDRLEGVSWEVSFAGVKLAPFAGAHDLAGISDHGGPIEALAERVAHEGARRRVVATHARVNVSKELAPLGDGHASLQDARRGAPVQLDVDEGERLGHPGDASVLGLVRGKFPPIHLGDVLVSPVSRAGAGSMSMASALSAS
jgi:hypothetical protein